MGSEAQKDPLNLGEDISFQDIFSENFNSLIYEDINEDVDNHSVSGEVSSGGAFEDSSQGLPLAPTSPEEGSLQSDEDELSVGDEEEEAIPEDLPPNYRNAKFLNERYLLKLQDFLDNLIEALQVNLARQNELEDEIQNLSGQKLLLKKKDSSSQRIFMKPRSLILFAAPYFKDIHMFSHPDNADTRARKAMEELSVYTLQPPKWMDTDKRKCKEAILSDAIHKRVKDLLDEEMEIQEKLSGLELSQRQDYEMRLKGIGAKLKEIKKIPEEELLRDLNEEFDWMKISVQTFKGVFNPRCIRCMWRNLLHPSINKGSWSKEEDARLKELALKYGCRNWSAIASELNTRRPPYLCLVRYQRKYEVKESLNRKWMKEEDLRLLALVKQCRISNYIPWSKVSYYMSNGRLKDMCYQRYFYLMRSEAIKGTFKLEEDFIIILGVNVFGTEWKKIERFLKKRTAAQISSRYNNSLSSNFSPWTVNEDKILLKVIKSKGIKNWGEIAELLTSRTRFQCRSRFMTICKAYRKDPKSFDLERCMKHTDTCYLAAKKRQDHIYKRLDELLKNCLEAENMDLEENEPIPTDFLLRVMSILHDKLNLGTSCRLSKLISRNPLKVAKVNKKEKDLQAKYNDFFRRFTTSKEGREKVRYKEEELQVFERMSTSVWKLLGCEESRLNLSEVKSEEKSEKHQQLLNIFLKCPKEFPNKRDSQEPLPQKPILKTYSRKKRLEPPSCPPSSSSQKGVNDVELAPPSATSCVAIKNILSFLIDLHVSNTGPWKREKKKTIAQSELEGIFAEKYSDMFMHLGLRQIDSFSSESDILLMRRFNSMFFWPALLSTVESKRFEDQTLFPDEEDVDGYLDKSFKVKRIRLDPKLK